MLPGMEEEELPPEEMEPEEDLGPMLRGDLKEWAKLQMSKDMAARNGKTLPGDELGGELPPEGMEDAPIPGVEEEEGLGDAGGGDEEKIRALLAALKAG